MAITVPACYACNLRWSVDEGRFRSVVVAMADEDKHLAIRKIVDTKLQSQLSKDPELREAFIEKMSIQSRVLPNGLVVPQPAFQLDLAMFSRVVGKMVRGLIFKENQRRVNGKPSADCFLPSSHVVQVWVGNDFWNEPKIRDDLIPAMGQFLNMGGTDDTFVWGRVRDRNDVWRWAYILIFYQSVSVFVQTVPIAEAWMPDPSCPA